MCKAIFYMTSGNVVELVCEHFSLTKNGSGKVTAFEYKGGEASCFALEIDRIEAIKVVKEEERK